jgi:hypothetical protein
MMTRRWRTMGRTMRTMSTQTMMPRHVHNRIHCRNYVHADPLHAHAHAQAPEILDETFADLQPESKTALRMRLRSRPVGLA